MGFQWTEDLSTGIVDIDNQHKELFAKINALLDAHNRHEGRASVSAYIEYLREYVAFHFAAEERDMIARTYPEHKQHEAQHEDFKKQVNKIFQDYQSQGTSDEVFASTVWASGEWFMNHINKTDKKMAVYLKQKKSDTA